MSLDPELILGTLELATEGLERRRYRNAINRFVAWTQSSTAVRLDRHAILEFGAEIGSRACLADLEKAIAGVHGLGASFRREVRAAVLDHRRRVDGQPMVADIVRACWWEPFVDRVNLDRLSVQQVKRVDGWLRWMHENRITLPSIEDFLEYASDAESAVPLESLKEAIEIMGLPRTPTTEINLPLAISRKRALSRGQNEVKPRVHWPRTRSVAREELPGEWLDGLDRLAREYCASRPGSHSRGLLPTVEKTLRTFYRWCLDKDVPPVVCAPTVLSFLLDMRARGCRNSTLEITANAFIRFLRGAEISTSEIDKIASFRREFKRHAQSETPLCFQRAARLGPVAQTLGKAVTLLRHAREATDYGERVEALCGAAALAFFSLVPLRVSDSNLQWGKHVTYTGTGYRLDVQTSKTGEPFNGFLSDFLTPFLDALLLKGCDDCFLDEMRLKAIRGKTLLFAHASGRNPSPKRVANLWSKHVGVRPHVARTRVHTELGKLGAEGTVMALALCAQRDPRIARFYQGREMNDFLLLKGSEILLEGFTESEIKRAFCHLSYSD